MTVKNILTDLTGPPHFSVMYNIGTITGKSVVNGVYAHEITPYESSQLYRGKI